MPSAVRPSLVEEVVADDVVAVRGAQEVAALFGVPQPVHRETVAASQLKRLHSSEHRLIPAKDALFLSGKMTW